jgi:hypothetical protein
MFALRVHPAAGADLEGILTFFLSTKNKWFSRETG